MTEPGPPEPASIDSPCVGHCTLDPETGWCLGCGRTIGEITDWGAKPPAERRAIRDALPARLTTLTLP